MDCVKHRKDTEMKFIIITDSNCDLSSEYLKENNVPVIPFHFNLNGKDYEDDFGKSISYTKFYDELRKGKMPTTAQISPSVYEEFFIKYVFEGYSIIYIGFSSALSESFNHSLIAQKVVMTENKDANITVIDSKCASVGQGILVYYACEMKRQGKSKEEIAAWVEDTKLKVNMLFTVDSLDHLRRGGRLSAASALFGTMLNVKPILFVDNEGKLAPKGRVRGRQKAISTLSQELKNRIINPDKQVVFICHGDCSKEAEHLKKLIMSNVNVKDVIINYLGPIIGTHTGPGLLVVAFIGNNRLIE